MFKNTTYDLFLSPLIDFVLWAALVITIFAFISSAVWNINTQYCMRIVDGLGYTQYKLDAFNCYANVGGKFVPVQNIVVTK